MGSKVYIRYYGVAILAWWFSCRLQISGLDIKFISFPIQFGIQNFLFSNNGVSFLYIHTIHRCLYCYRTYDYIGAEYIYAFVNGAATVRGKFYSEKNDIINLPIFRLFCYLFFCVMALVFEYIT